MSQTINISQASDLNVLNITEKMQDDAGKLRNGEIHLGKKHYDVTFRDNKAEVRRHFYGFSGWVMSFFVKTNTATAQAIQAKINAVISEEGKETASKKNSFAIISNTRAKLNEVVKENPNKKVIEVADYGLASNRNIVKDSRLVDYFNVNLDDLEDNPQKINFNKIDGYNTLIGILPETLMPTKLPATLKKIANKSLSIDPRVKEKSNYGLKRVQEWKNFLARPENLAKINIPEKLYKYLHLDKGFDTGKQTGWEAEFRANKDNALKAFVMKNTPYSNRDASEETIDLVAGKIKEYVEIFHMDDSPEKEAKFKEFFDEKNWMGPYEEAKLNEYIDDYGEEDGRELFKSNMDDIMNHRTFLMFVNIFTTSTFRQTSKLGLDFFKEQGVPVLFQFSDYSGKSLKGREDEIRNNPFWKQGYTTAFNKGIGSAITHSEMRHAFRLLEQNDATNGRKANIKFVEGGIHS